MKKLSGCTNHIKPSQTISNHQWNSIEFEQGVLELKSSSVNPIPELAPAASRREELQHADAVFKAHLETEKAAAMQQEQALEE